VYSGRGLRGCVVAKVLAVLRNVTSDYSNYCVEIMSSVAFACFCGKVFSSRNALQKHARNKGHVDTSTVAGKLRCPASECSQR